MTKPSFAEWLADPHALDLTIYDGGEMLDWVGQSYGEQGVNAILDAMIEHYGEIGGSQEVTVTKNDSIDVPWKVIDSYGRGSVMPLVSFRIVFKTTDAYL